jgi:hypothetical protein
MYGYQAGAGAVIFGGGGVGSLAMTGFNLWDGLLLGFGLLAIGTGLLMGLRRRHANVTVEPFGGE